MIHGIGVKVINSKKGLITSIVALAVVFVLISLPLGPLPPLEKLLNPSEGIWAPQGNPYFPGATNLTISYDNSTASVQVFKEADGFIGIASNNTCGMYYEQGYLEAQYRLEEMVLLEKTATGTLSSLIGNAGLQSDIFYRDLQDCQIAAQEVAGLSRTGYTYHAVKAFVAGINDYITTLGPANIPLLFKVLNYQPQTFNMTEIFAIQQLFLWQNSAGGLGPIYFNFALQKMPENVVKALYPAYPAGIQNPIVPYSLNPGVYNESGDISNLSLYSPYFNYSLSSPSPSPLAHAVMPLLTPGTLGESIASATNIQCSRDFSNDWAVNGVKTGNTSALLANDPHLTTSVPSIWMGFQLVSPGENAIGVTFPSFPGIVLGHNNRLSWGATNAQVQETYFYAEMVNLSKPYEYYSNGNWAHFNVINESIPVAGGPSSPLTIRVADNGVVVVNCYRPIAMDWTGFSPSYELSFFLHIDSAASVLQFRDNLSKYYRVAIQNFAVADSGGNIGIFPWGNYPVINGGNPRGIMPGTGQYNWVGFIPFQKLPFLYDPSRGFVFSANQITVSSNYPYYIGWDYESGYRADQIHALLNASRSMNVAGMESVQLNVHDFTTDLLLQPLVKAVGQYSQSYSSQYNTLKTWNGTMTVDSTAATIYYFWLQNMVNDTFRPYLQKYGINASEGLNQTSYFLGPDSTYHGPLIEDLVNWTVKAPDISWFNNPLTGQVRNFTTLADLAFNQTVEKLTSLYGPFSSSWNWGNIHKRYLSSLAGITLLNTQSLPAAGDSNTINAAYGLLSDFGPSWRQVINMSDPLSGVGIYPGGISENPLSVYYENTFVDWNNGAYYLLIPQDAPTAFFYLYRAGVQP